MSIESIRNAIEIKRLEGCLKYCYSIRSKANIENEINRIKLMIKELKGGIKNNDRKK